jgi:hypothetical protein
MSAKTFLPAFVVAVSQMVVEAATSAYPSDYIIEHILKLSSYIIDLAGNSNLFGKPDLDLYSPSLNTLFARLQKKQVAPSLLPPGFLTVERIHARIYERSDEEAVDRPLAEYEDLYYALVARMKEMHQLLNLRIDSGFNVASENVFEGGPTIAELHNSLSEYWNILNNPSCGKALDDAIREARVQALRYELVWQVENDNMSAEDAREQLSQLYSSDVYNGILGLNFVQDWAPAMIGAYLEQKYRHMLDLEKEEAAVKARLERRQGKLKSMRNILTGAPAVRKIPARRQARAVRKAAQEFNTKTDDKAERPTKVSNTKTEEVKKSAGDKLNVYHKYHSKEGASMQHSPEYQVQIHPGRHHQEHTAAFHNQDIEQGIAQQELLMVLQWQLKTQRVSEYSDYLRARASQNAQGRVQANQGPVVDGFVGTSSSSTVSRRGGGEFCRPEMDFSQYEKF